MAGIKRRDVLQMAVGLVTAASAKVAWAQSSVKYGPVDVQRHRHLANQGIHLHVFHRGREVTDCFFADDTGDGFAHRFLTNADGRRYLVPGPGGVPAQETIYGITMRPGAPWR